MGGWVIITRVLGNAFARQNFGAWPEIYRFYRWCMSHNT